MVQAYILVQTEVGKAAEVAVRIAAISGVTQAEDVTGPYDVIVRAEAENVDDLGRLVVAQIQAVSGITRTLTRPLIRAAPAPYSCCPPVCPGFSRAASAAVRVPSPSSRAPLRSAGSSTSRRRPARPGRVISAAPAARCRAADPGPNLGRNAVPGRTAYRVVPDPAKSGTNACGHRAAARSALLSSAGRRAGRSAASPPMPDRGQRDPAYAAPCRSASLSPCPGRSRSEE